MTQLIPEGKQHFDDANGRPLVGGQVFNYSVGTTTFKNTYQDVALSILNTNPVVLDARGECAMYGTGAYRQILKDAAGNLIWDQVVPDPAPTTVQVVSIPVITGPTTASPGSTITLSASALSLLGAGSIASFTWTLPGGATSVTPATGNAATKAITPTGAVGATYVISVFATDNAGNVSQPMSYTITVVTHAAPTTPTTLTVPATVYQNSTGNQLTVSGSTATDGATITYSLTQSGATAVTFSKTTGIAAGEVVTFSVPAVSGTTNIVISATAVDSLGGISPAKNANVQILTAPTVPGTAFGGGFYVGRMLISGVNYALILAPKATGEAANKCIKSFAATATAGTQSVWDGLSNSNAIVAADPGSPATQNAATFCRQLSIGGFTDWCVPAKDQLELIYRTFKPSTTANNTASGANASSNPTGSNYTAGSPTITAYAPWASGGVESFGAVAYWTSTEYAPSTGAGCTQNFDTGYQFAANKNDTTVPVRAVRMVTV